jgi:hypothetical protein
VFSQKDDPVPWAPGVYASVSASHADSCFAGGFYVAHHHHEADGIAGDLEAARELKPSALWSFIGTLSNHAARGRLRDVRDPDGLVLDTQHFSNVVRWAWQSSHRVQGREAFSTYATTLGESFVLCPRGYGSSTIRSASGRPLSRGDLRRLAPTGFGRSSRFCLTLDVTTSQRLSLLASGLLEPIAPRGYRAARRDEDH